MLAHFSNEFDPRGEFTPDDEKMRLAEWIATNGYRTGRPEASEEYTVEEFKAMGMVGVYKDVDNA